MAFEDHDDAIDDLTEAAQAALFDEAMEREARHEARAEPAPDPDPEPEAR